MTGERLTNEIILMKQQRGLQDDPVEPLPVQIGRPSASELQLVYEGCFAIGRFARHTPI